ncbi:hypothetical protein [Streptomyces sp. NBC_00162]|uniref:hypothetical protein n=1 Tax=Streptomyces sp. NBC_00162 TaxID=2903629 RepID=UPI00214B9DA0|nr:hypothetical protein [Streptomyces sp. NBC_00162]UUU37947.1 hypothetical protein JIW86_03130 [Streptomyces sp. NBC_00162]
MPADTLRFHGRAAELAGLDLEISKEAEAVLDRFESVHGHVVPASVREWFALAQGAAVLRKFSNDDMAADTAFGVPLHTGPTASPCSAHQETGTTPPQSWRLHTHPSPGPTWATP